MTKETKLLVHYNFKDSFPTWKVVFMILWGLSQPLNEFMHFLESSTDWWMYAAADYKFWDSIDRRVNETDFTNRRISYRQSHLTLRRSCNPTSLHVRWLQIIDVHTLWRWRKSNLIIYFRSHRRCRCSDDVIDTRGRFL